MSISSMKEVMAGGHSRRAEAPVRGQADGWAEAVLMLM